MYRLGLDIGTNSIGWACVTINEGEKCELLGWGSRIFPHGRDPQSGLPLNEERRLARLARRQRERRKRRKSDMLRYLAKTGIFPQTKEEQQKLCLLKPYKLRCDALERKLEKEELGRVLMQFAGRRGFKSSRKNEDVKDKDAGNLKRATADLEEALQDMTLGQWFAKRLEKKEGVRFSPFMVKNKNDWNFFPLRSMYEKEFGLIRQKQEPHYQNLDWNKIARIIFWQRPLKHPERGCCEFYQTEKRAYKAMPSAQYFRAIQMINNLTYYDGDRISKPITDEMRKSILVLIKKKKKITFQSLKKEFYDYEIAHFNYETDVCKDITGLETDIDFASEKMFGKAWLDLPLNERDLIIEQLIVAENDDLVKQVIARFNLSAEQIDQVLSYSFKSGVTNLSSKFMIECAEIMHKNNVIYNEACEIMGFHHSEKQTFKIRRSLPLYKEALDDKREISNPTVHIALNQLRKLVNRLIYRFGNPSEIIVEMARDLKMSQKDKINLLSRQKKNKEENERIEKEIESIIKARPAGGYIKKFKLWEELGPSLGDRCCPYCGKKFSGKMVLTNAVQIDHILPYSRTLNNDYNNLIIACEQCNKLKLDKTPFEAFGHSPQGYNWDAIMSRIEKLPIPKQRKFYLDSMKYYDEKENGFTRRHLQDTQYITRVALRYLSFVCDKKKIFASKGRMTALVRAKWGLNKLLNASGDMWEKNREDNRHHAIDALVIALLDLPLIQKLASMNKKKGYEDIVVPSFDFSHTMLRKMLENMAVSHKLNRGIEGILLEKTALGKRTYFEDGKNKEKYVTRKPIAIMNENELGRVCNRYIREDLQKRVIKIKVKSADELHMKLEKYGKEKGIKRLRYVFKDQNPVHVGNYNKHYMADDYHHVDVWKIPVKSGKFKYEGKFISRFEAAKKKTDKKKDIHPAATFLMTLHKNDVVEISDRKNIKELCLIVGLDNANKRLDICSLNTAGHSGKWIEQTREDMVPLFWKERKRIQNHIAINKLFSDFTIKKVNIAVDGTREYR